MSGPFSPVSVKASPVQRVPENGNLTGNPREIRDIVADAYNLIQKWNTHQILGRRIINNIVTLKVAAFDRDNYGHSQIYPEGLQEVCDQLKEVCEIMNEVVVTLKLIQKKVGAIVQLENRNNIAKTPMFITWPADKFSDTLLTISEAYSDELKVKISVKENIAHTDNKPALILHAAAWEHQPYITPHIDLTLESLLIETGHR